ADFVGEGLTCAEVELGLKTRRRHSASRCELVTSGVLTLSAGTPITGCVACCCHQRRWAGAGPDDGRVATVVVKRPARRPAPEMPSGELVLDAPPEIPPPPARQWMQALMVVPMIAMMAAMMLMFSGSLAGTIRYIIYGLMGLGMLGMVIMGVLQGGGPSKREMGYARRKYLRHLAQHRLRLRRAVRRQRVAMEYLHPDPSTLWALVASYRLWERRK